MGGMKLVVIIMLTSNVLMLISLICMRRALKFKEKAKEAWGQLMYTKGYKDMRDGKRFNPDQTYETIQLEEMVERICDDLSRLA
jgi:hypothetical protein